MGVDAACFGFADGCPMLVYARGSCGVLRGIPGANVSPGQCILSRRCRHFPEHRSRKMPPAGLPLCEKPLSPDDRKAWKQAIVMLVGLKIWDGIGAKDLATAVGTARIVVARSVAIARTAG